MHVVNEVGNELQRLQERVQKLEQENTALKKELNLYATPKDKPTDSPIAFHAQLKNAEETVAKYFESIYSSPTTGQISINDDRYVLIRASSLSYDFFKEIRRLYSDTGDDIAFDIGQNFLFDIGHVLGSEDAKQFHAKTKLNSPIERLLSGPAYFAHSGWAFVEILSESTPTPDKDFFLKYNHPNSFEADSWVKKGKRSDKPVCIMNAAYSSGWCEQSFGIELTAVEVSCKARGDDKCTFIMAPPDQIARHLPSEEKPVSSHHKVPVFFERKHIESTIRKSLEEKETLLKEIHHRVKNNLQVITSLLSLQFKGIDDIRVIDAVTKSKTRIQSMALIHTKLYQSKNLASIKFGVYINELIESIATSYALNDNVTYTVKYPEANFDIDLSINLGLIINELISNAYKHAFKANEKGSIDIDLMLLGENSYQLVIRDNGIGMPEKVDIESPKTFGLEIVSTLVKQIGGTIHICSENGLKYTILFEK